MAAMKYSSQKTTAEQQVKKFRDAARELGCDEDEAAFEDKLRRIGHAPTSKKQETDKVPE